MAAIKKFFEKKKLDIKFKKAGDGQKLSDEKRPLPGSSTSYPKSAGSSRAGPSSEARTAAEAAMARVEQKKAEAMSGPVGTGSAAIKAQVRREMEAERKAREKALAESDIFAAPQEIYYDNAPVLSVTGVYFKCPLAGPAVLPKANMEQYIKDFLMTQLPIEPKMTSALMIHTLNKDKEKVKACIDILVKYLDNIVTHIGELKYCKIRINNKTFQEKVAPVEGALEFMQAAGFEQKIAPGANEIEEEYFIMDSDRAMDVDHLMSLKNVLLAAEAVKPELDNNLKIFHPSANATRIEVPDEFYNYTAEELKREQKRQQDAAERLGMLRTKEMRDREHLRELRRYRYTLIRIRFPDGILIQGTFRAADKLSSVKDFVRETLENDWMPFTLNSQTGHRLTEDNLTLAELDLAPAAIINFNWDQSILADIASQQGSVHHNVFLKPELMLQIETLK